MNRILCAYAERLKGTQNGYRSYPRKVICDECGSELEYEESDLYDGAYGAVYVKCCLCGNDVMLHDNEHTVILTDDNVEFPKHFYHVSASTGAIDICDNEHVREYIKEGISYLKAHNGDFWYTSTGNLVLYLHKYEDEYFVVVSNDYYELPIPFWERE